MRIPCLLLLCSLLIGCSLIQKQALDATYAQSWFNLQPPTALNQPLIATQFVAFHYGDTRLSSINQVEWYSDKITIALLSHMGGALVTMIYDGNGLEIVDGMVLPMQFHAGYLLRDYQLTFLPPAAVRDGFKESSLRLEVNSRQRQIFKNDSLLISIDYSSQDVWQGKVIFRNIQRGYTLELDTIEVNYLE